MRLFQILTRCVATGKTKVTRKLFKQVQRETHGNPCSMPPIPSQKKCRGVTRLCYVALSVVLALPICLVSGYSATLPHSGAGTTGTRAYSAVALFNQANAYARSGQTGPAILNYERALLLAPTDADVAANLHFARAKAGLPDAPKNWFARSLTFARPNTMAWLGGFGVMLAGMSLILVRLFPQRRLAYRSLTVVGSLLFATAIGSAITIWPKMNEAIVTTDEAPACITPVSTAEAAFKLLVGETVTVCAEHQGFALVQTSAGRTGWVARADLARVVPPMGIAAPSPHRS